MGVNILYVIWIGHTIYGHNIKYKGRYYSSVMLIFNFQPVHFNIHLADVNTIYERE